MCSCGYNIGHGARAGDVVVKVYADMLGDVVTKVNADDLGDVVAKVNVIELANVVAERVRVWLQFWLQYRPRCSAGVATILATTRTNHWPQYRPS